MNAAEVIETVSNESFVKRVQEIAAEEPSYRIGGSGKDGTCDCIGLIMGAMQREENRQYPIHSTNYFARYEMQTLNRLPGAELETGALVYKARENSGQLNDRYQPGGRYDTGDPLDYYHVGVIESVNPMRIVHCTQTAGVDGITWDTNTRGWTHAGRLKNVDYDGKGGVQVDPKAAIVTTPDGKKLNVRARPSTKGTLTDRLAVGTRVQVEETARNEADELWSRITYSGKTGYVMDMYLHAEDEARPDTPETVSVALPKNTARELLEALIKVLGDE